MSVRTGVIAFGMSASLLAGGATSIHESFQQGDKEALEKACLTPQLAGEKACQNMVVTPTPEIINNTHIENGVYGWLGGVLVVGGVIGMMTAFGEVSEGDGPSIRFTSGSFSSETEEPS
jgi:hypothetical protein